MCCEDLFKRTMFYVEEFMRYWCTYVIPGAQLSINCKRFVIMEVPCGNPLRNYTKSHLCLSGGIIQDVHYFLCI